MSATRSSLWSSITFSIAATALSVQGVSLSLSGITGSGAPPNPGGVTA